MQKILVAYASKYGSTAEIAATIGNSIQSDLFEVRVRSVTSVKSVREYEAVVLGSAIYAGNWMSEAVAFLEKHESDLAERPVWLFSSGPTGTDDPKELLGGWVFPEELQPIADRIGPRDITLFHGKIDPEKLNWGERLLVRAMSGTTGDYRNWDAIRAWTQSVVSALPEV